MEEKKEVTVKTGNRETSVKRSVVKKSVENLTEVKKEIKKPKFQLDKVITLGSGLRITPEMITPKLERYIKNNYPEVYAKYTK